MHNNNNGYPSSTRAWMTVAILMLAYVLSFVDRQILNLLVEPIRRDLDITDTHMSLLMGFSFAVFYTICGVPIGRLADRKSRRGIIAIGVLVWSLMTALCGTAKTFWHFLVFRIGVGVGEAALSPSAYSLIADSFPPKLRGTAMSVYSMGIYIGSGLAFLLGGLVVKFASAQGDVELPVLGMVRPWQLIFLVLGAAGVLFAAVLLLIREPSRKGVGAGVEVPLSEVAGYIRQNRRTVLCHNFGFACLAFAAYGSSAWIPTFFIRTYGWSASDVGVLYGSVVAVAGSIGIIAGGRLSDLLHRRGYRDAPLRVGIISAALTLPLNLAYLAGTGELALALIALELARRLEIPLQGVNFPGHFMLRVPGADHLLDPCGGRRLYTRDCRDQLYRQLGPGAELSAEHLQTADAQAMLRRLSRNLRMLHMQHDDPDAALKDAERVLLLGPATPDRPEESHRLGKTLYFFCMRTVWNKIRA